MSASSPWRFPRRGRSSPLPALSPSRSPRFSRTSASVQEGMDDDRPPDHPDRRAGAQRSSSGGARSCSTTSLRLRPRRAGLIEGSSSTVRPGEKIGLVGRSGAGKTTLVNLLLRFHDLEGGRILIDGQDIAPVTQESLRGSIAWSRRTPRCCTARSARTSLRPAATPREAEIVAAAAPGRRRTTSSSTSRIGRAGRL